MRLFAESSAATIGLALVASAAAAHQQWLDLHFLPSFFWPRQWCVLEEWFARGAAAAVGMAFVLGARPYIGRFVACDPGRALQIVLAAVLALGASEVALRRIPLLAAEEQSSDQEPRCQRHPQLGWTFIPARVGQNKIGGRTIEYVFDRAGYRVSRADQPVDPERPTILFTGESLMAGQGLTWQESVPGQLQALLRTQSANLAVHGYANDQAYLRLRAELPRFRRPVAVVSLFMPALFDRNLDDDRPRLGPGLVWLPPERHWRLTGIARWVAPYRRADTVERGILVTREVLRATLELARSRAAMPLIVMPQFGREDPAEQMLRRRVLDEPGLPYLRIDLDPGWRIPWDRHPDPRAARAIAAAIAARLRGSFCMREP